VVQDDGLLAGQLMQDELAVAESFHPWMSGRTRALVPCETEFCWWTREALDVRVGRRNRTPVDARCLVTYSAVDHEDAVKGKRRPENGQCEHKRHTQRGDADDAPLPGWSFDGRRPGDDHADQGDAECRDDERAFDA